MLPATSYKMQKKLLGQPDTILVQSSIYDISRNIEPQTYLKGNHLKAAGFKYVWPFQGH